ncbi:fumarylacetoacetate hydrolase family protein [Blastopirellula sp. JC732]|uniref:Fumarylacetoacetate hydrolase family protein n=1 Tax=Blastopirellula sediminis TaxID=2894196 RepID=A0A9X1MPQ4_9BACT|nr:fumarylacetoacetate hydrolase family protein [Blastopirellula sediminis]MCC9605557.1 fumarylacetoacetate hydrolase family protein [Blastopirellula sediminis]MCC9631143.1 fumarylacetoacetate hydrolase family protein [Blastopirellula sediminis]
MQLIQFGPLGKEKPGLLTAGGVRKDLSSVVERYDRDFFQAGGLARLAELAGSLDSYPDVPEAVRWGAPIARPGKVICVGLNYADHAKESGMAIPEEPIIFFKGTNTVVGPYDEVLIPRKSEKTDWEVELGVVIGKEARYLDSASEAAACIAGYCISNDVSERHFQLERGGQWVKGKSCDTFNPLGPFMATTDEIADVSDLAMTLEVNGERMQTGNTKTMIFDPCFVIHYLSQFMTLEAGDLISTGTPPGVGLGLKPPRFLKAGDVMTLSIAGLGEQRQVCKDA